MLVNDPIPQPRGANAIPREMKRRLAQLASLDSLPPHLSEGVDFSEREFLRFENWLQSPPALADAEKELEDSHKKGLVALIHTASEYNDEPALRRALLEVPTSSLPSIINSTDWAGETALHKVSQFDCFECAKVLLDHGADIEAIDTNGECPLHKAAREGSMRCLKLLLLKGEKTDCCEDCREQQENNNKNKKKAKESWWRCSWAHYYFLFAGLSTRRSNETGGRKKGLYVNRKDFKGETALHKAAVGDTADASGDKSKGAAALLLSGEARRCKHDEAINKRNLDGQTPCHLAACLNRTDMLKYLVEEKSARYKAGTLASEDLAVRTCIFFAFFFMGCLGMLVIVLIFWVGKDKSVWKTRHDTRKDENVCEKWYKLPNKKGGLLLQPNWILFLGVFVFMIVKFFVETQALPAMLFVWFWYKLHGMVDNEKAKLKEEELKAATASTGIHADLEVAAAVTTNPMQRFSQSDEAASTAATAGAATASFDGIEANVNKNEWLVALWERHFDPRLEILKQWRIQQFQSYLKKSYKYHHWDFFIQPEYIFLYLQAAYSIVSMAVMYHNMVIYLGGVTLGSKDLYIHIFARVVNSAVPSTVFSLFKMIIFDHRWVQIRHAESIMGSWLGPCWMMFIAVPVIIIVPPIVTHIVPGIFMFIWIVLALAFVYYCIRRLYRVLYPFEVHALFRASEEKHLPVCQVLTVHGGGWLFGGNEFFGPVGSRVVTESEFSQYVYFHPRLPLYRYFFWFVLEIFTRFAFILLIQVLYDYVSIAIYLDMSGYEGGSSYSTVLRKTYDLRSQSRCYADAASKSFVDAIGIMFGTSS